MRTEPRTRQTEVSQVFRALSDTTRRRMIERLSEGPVPASQLAKPLGISVAAVVQHLQVLEECSLIRTQKVGRTRMCSMEPAGLGVIEKWIQERRASWERKLDRLGRLLAEEDDLPDVDL